MDLSLTRVDLLSVDTTKRGCLRVLPLGKKNPGKTQKVVVGDGAGTVHCFGMKKGDVSTIFKGSMERGVSRVELGGTLDDRDKIFVAGGQTVKAWSRKGREFLKFNTNLSEEITSMHVLNDDIWTGGEFIYNQFRCARLCACLLLLPLLPLVPSRLGRRLLCAAHGCCRATGPSPAARSATRLMPGAQRVQGPAHVDGKRPHQRPDHRLLHRRPSRAKRRARLPGSRNPSAERV